LAGFSGLLLNLGCLLLLPYPLLARISCSTGSDFPQVQRGDTQFKRDAIVVLFSMCLFMIVGHRPSGVVRVSEEDT
jgi:hypothetical protein